MPFASRDESSERALGSGSPGALPVGGERDSSERDSSERALPVGAGWTADRWDGTGTPRGELDGAERERRAVAAALARYDREERGQPSAFPGRGDLDASFRTERFLNAFPDRGNLDAGAAALAAG